MRTSAGRWPGSLSWRGGRSGGVHPGRVCVLLHCAGWSVQGLAGRVAERDEAAVTAWRAGDKRTAAVLGAWLVFEDQSGQGLRPPKGRTWVGVGTPGGDPVTGGQQQAVPLERRLP